LAPLPAIAILQEMLQGPGMNCDALRQALSDLLFQQGRDQSGLVILSPPECEGGVSVNLLAIGETQTDADGMLAEAMRRLMPAP
jgi:hypothetical protein